MTNKNQGRVGNDSPKQQSSDIVNSISAKRTPSTPKPSGNKK